MKNSLQQSQAMLFWCYLERTFHGHIVRTVTQVTFTQNEL